MTKRIITFPESNAPDLVFIADQIEYFDKYHEVTLIINSCYIDFGSITQRDIAYNNVRKAVLSYTAVETRIPVGYITDNIPNLPTVSEYYGGTDDCN